MATRIGPATCPLCDGEISATLMSTGRVMLTCNHADCRMQLMTRGDGADQRCRDRYVHAAGGAPADAPAPKAPEKMTPAPVPAPVDDKPPRESFRFGLW